MATAAALMSSASVMVVKSAPLGGEPPAFALAPAAKAAPVPYLRNPQFPPVAKEASLLPAQSGFRLATYKVSPGDTVSTIAQQFGISSETIVQANNLKNENQLAIGEELVILPVSGVMHAVKPGDTLSAIARTYKVSEADILGYAPNDLTNADSLQVGQKLVVPGGKALPPPPPPPPARSTTPPAPAPRAPTPAPPPQAPRRGTGQFSWPTTGPITQYFSAYHPAIDIAPRFGTPIYAADAGRVTRIEQLSWGYGWNLYIDHGNGFVTHYSHVASFAVSVGEYVGRGQLIARVGSTGRSSGPHLDFEIYYNGVPVNPLNYLP